MKKLCMRAFLHSFVCFVGFCVGKHFSTVELLIHKVKWEPVYDFESSVDGKCRCTRSRVGYSNEAACLKSMKDEACLYDEIASEQLPYPFYDCRFAFSKVMEKSNTDCNAACEMLNSRNGNYRDFADSCTTGTYYVRNNNIQLKGMGCIDQMIHGHSDDTTDDISNAAFKVIEDVQSAADCQQYCEEELQCVRWFWRIRRSTSNEREGYPPYTCFLKDEGHTIGSMYGCTYYRDIQNTHGKTCNDTCPSDIEMRCSYNSNADGVWFTNRGCTTCDGLARCIWHSNEHVAGYPYCILDDTVDKCNDLTRESVVKHAASTKRHVRDNSHVQAAIVV